MASRVAFAVTLSKSLLLVRTTNDARRAMDGESLIAKSDPVFTDESVSTAATGVIVSRTFSYKMPVALDIAADVLAALRWKITVAGGVGSTGRMNLDIKKNGAAIAGVTKANGATRALQPADGGVATAPSKEEILHVAIPPTPFAQGDTLDFVVELEVVASAAGTATWRVFHDPSVVGSEMIAEVNV